MKCPICNFNNSDDSKFCCGCGKLIPRCPTCGKVITTRDRFCVHDGTRLPDELLMLIPEEEEVVEQVEVGVKTEPVAAHAMEETVRVPKKSAPTAYCLLCGAPVRKGEDYCAGCRSDSRKGESVCVSCGMPCAPGEDYCSYCRPSDPVPVANMDYIPPVTTSRQKKGSALTVILVVLLLLLIGAAGVLVAAEFDLIELPDIFASDDSDRDRDKDRDRGDKDDDEGEKTPGKAEEATASTAPTAAASAETTAPTTEAPTETAPQPTEPPQTKLEYFMENCDSMLFTYADIYGFDKTEARYARNACYAHGGRKFKDTTLQSYYEKYDWYTPTYEPSYFDQHEADLMNYYMRENLKLIREYEKEMGFG